MATYTAWQEHNFDTKYKDSIKKTEAHFIVYTCRHSCLNAKLNAFIEGETPEAKRTGKLKPCPILDI